MSCILASEVDELLEDLQILNPEQRKRLESLSLSKRAERVTETAAIQNEQVGLVICMDLLLIIKFVEGSCCDHQLEQKDPHCHCLIRGFSNVPLHNGFCSYFCVRLGM